MRSFQGSFKNKALYICEAKPGVQIVEAFHEIFFLMFFIGFVSVFNNKNLSAHNIYHFIQDWESTKGMLILEVSYLLLQISSKLILALDLKEAHKISPL